MIQVYAAGYVEFTQWAEDWRDTTVIADLKNDHCYWILNI